MFSALAYAESADPNAMNLPAVLGALLIVAATAVLAFLLIFTSRARRHRQAEVIAVAAFFWALIAAGSMLYAQETQMKWSKEYTMRLETGYLDPQDTRDAPKLPWGLWSGLAVAYAAMLAWALSQKHPNR